MPSAPSGLHARRIDADAVVANREVDTVGGDSATDRHLTGLRVQARVGEGLVRDAEGGQLDVGRRALIGQDAARVLDLAAHDRATE